MNISPLVQAAEAADCRIALLVEGGAFPEDDFSSFYDKHRARLYSLYLHPQLEVARMMGPWLLEVENVEALTLLMNLQVPGAGVIFHTASVSALAAQLSWGCTPVTPDKKTVISRFYTRDVLQALARCADVDWHAFLFKSINAWWTPDEDAWKSIVIPSSTYENPLNHAVHIDSETWAQIADRPEIESMLNQWQARPSAREFPPCAQRSMVIKALNKARGVGLSIPEEQKLYALVWLDGKKSLLASEIFQKALPVVVRGERRLSEVLLEAERSDINKGKSDGIF